MATEKSIEQRIQDAEFNVGTTVKWIERLESGKQAPKVENEVSIAKTVLRYEKALLSALQSAKE